MQFEGAMTAAIAHAEAAAAVLQNMAALMAAIASPVVGANAAARTKIPFTTIATHSGSWRRTMETPRASAH